jgi:CMP-N,N'-diacetyllegionaminic acid synthase
VRGALAATRVTRVVVSTDDPEMLELAVGAGADAPFGLRPASLGTDTSRTVDVLAHALDALREGGEEDPDMFVMLQPTSPFRTAEDIDGAVRLLEETDGVEAVVSVCEAAHHPMKMHKLGEDGLLAPFVHNPYGTVNRKELPLALQENGSMYVQDTASFRANKDAFYCGLKSNRIVPYFMPAEASVDLDTEVDWKIGEILLATREAEVSAL